MEVATLVNNNSVRRIDGRYPIRNFRKLALDGFEAHLIIVLTRRKDRYQRAS
jgi:hypothetical protein